MERRDGPTALVLTRQGVPTLDNEDREVFLMREVGGLSYAEIAAACGTSLDSVRARQLTEQLLRARFPDTTFRRYTGSVGFIMRHATPEDADRIAAEVDAVVGTTAD